MSNSVSNSKTVKLSHKKLIDKINDKWSRVSDYVPNVFGTKVIRMQRIPQNQKQISKQ